MKRFLFKVAFLKIAGCGLLWYNIIGFFMIGG